MHKSSNREDVTPISNTIDRAAARIGLGKTMIYAYIKSGELRTFKAGTRRLVLESELQRFVERLSGSAA